MFHRAGSVFVISGILLMPETLYLAPAQCRILCHTLTMMMKPVLIIFLFAISFVFGCAGVQPRVSEQQASARESSPSEREGGEEPGRMRQQQVADVYALAGDDWTPVWTPDIQRAGESLDRWTVPTAATPQRETEQQESQRQLRQAQGYRIQIANVTSEQAAERYRQEALVLFDSVYVIFQRPNYKVRAGDFVHRSEADAYLDTCRVSGFRDAWVVPSRVWVIDQE